MSENSLTPQERGKKAAGEAAVDRLVRPGMKLGLGTGSTAKWAILRTAQRYRQGELDGLLVVPTSFDTEILCQNEGLPVRSLQDAAVGARLDLVLDGADEITRSLDCIKGGGGAHLQEKIVCDAGDVFALVADDSKLVSDLGTKFPIPLEIHALARMGVIRSVEKLGGAAQLRYGTGKAGPIVTDNGHLILDVRFARPVDPATMAADLKLITGVFEVGLFPGRASVAFLGRADGGVTVLERGVKG